MPQFSRTWWGNRFIDALEAFTDAGRLSRGRSYARGGKVRQFEIQAERVTALVKGSVNSYFGTDTAPTYVTTIQFQPILAEQWSAAIALIASKASLISRLLLNEMPENIEETFASLGLHLLPRRQADFEARCSCPDWNNPCKHIAGVYYLVAEELDRDPFLLFELRGLSRDALKAELAKSPLGQALLAELSAQMPAPDAVSSYYTTPTVQPVPADLTLKAFWLGARRLPQSVDIPQPMPVSAIFVKKQGDFPAFWHKDESFIAVMEELYERVKTKNRALL